MFKFFRKKKTENATLIDGRKTIAEIETWLETCGIERSTAAHIMGFLSAYGIVLPQVKLCTHGLTYSFENFKDWFYTPSDDTTPKENSICIFWNKTNSEAVIAVLTDVVCNKKGKKYYVASNGFEYLRCMRFDTLAQYRCIINTPDDIEIPLPQLAYERVAKAKENNKTDKKVN